MTLPRRLIEARPSEECGCPEEGWIVGTLEVLIHYEASGSGHIIVDAGEWQDEEFVDPCPSMDHLRNRAFDKCEAYPQEQA